MRDIWVTYPRFRVMQVRTATNPLFKWQVHYYTNARDRGTPVFNGISVEKCWDFVSQYPYPLYKRYMMGKVS